MRRLLVLLTASVAAIVTAGCAQGLPHIEQVEPAPMHAPPTVLLPPSTVMFSPPLTSEPNRVDGR
ncbi:hypothetical protein [Mycobacterium sp. C31M]